MKKVPIETLSEKISRLLETFRSKDKISLNRFIESTEGRGLYLVMMLMCLPFISPISIPGLSNVVGIVIVVLAVRMAFKLPPRLPNFIGGRNIPIDKLVKVVKAMSRLLRFLENFVRPRYSRITTIPPVRWATAICFLVMGVLLALPIPPVIPLSNSLPSWGIILVALASMEKDGLVLFAGYAISAAAFAYLAVFAGAITVNLNHLLPIAY